MKQLSIFTIALVLLAQIATAQTEATLFTTLDNDVSALKIRGNELYIAESIFFSGKITKTDLTQSPVVFTTVVNEVTATTMDFVGDQLYWLQDGIQLATVNVAAPNPTPAVVFNWPISNLFIQKIVSDGTQLYVLELQIDSNGMAERTQITQITLQPAVVRTVFYATNQVIRNIDYYNGKIYMLNESSQNIEVIDATNGPNPTSDIVNNEQNFYSGIKVVGPKVYASSADQIYRYQLNEPMTAGVGILLDSPVWPYWIENHGNHTLYFAEQQLSKKIYRISIDESSATTTPAVSSDWGIAPNPGTDYISIQGLLSPARYQIYGVNGNRLGSGTIAERDRIDIQSFVPGVYWLQLDNGHTRRFVKQ